MTATKPSPSIRATRLATRAYPFLPLLSRIPSLFGTTQSIPPNDSTVLGTNGIRVRLRSDPMWGTLWRQAVYEPFATKVFRRIVRSGDTVFDVGTNFGWFAALFAKWSGPSGRVHAFEPIGFIADIAAETLQLSEVTDRVTLNRVGLGADSGEFTVFTFAGLPLGHASASDLGRDDARPHVCSLTTLDMYARDNGIQRVDFLKLDVEGHELDVLRGARELLLRPDAPVVYFETNTKCLDHRGLRAQEIVELLREVGYEDFLTFSVRRGFEPRTSLPDNSSGDHLAFKTGRDDCRRRALSTNRWFRY